MRVLQVFVVGHAAGDGAGKVILLRAQEHFVVLFVDKGDNPFMEIIPRRYLIDKGMESSRPSQLGALFFLRINLKRLTNNRIRCIINIEIERR